MVNVIRITKPKLTCIFEKRSHAITYETINAVVEIGIFGSYETTKYDRYGCSKNASLLDQGNRIHHDSISIDKHRAGVRAITVNP
jgi:hypothetical protein